MTEPYQLHPDVLVLRRADGSACLVHLDGKACILDAAAVEQLDRVLSPDARLEVADSDFVGDLVRERLIHPRGAPLKMGRRVWPALLRRGLHPARRSSAVPRQAAWLLVLARLGVARLGWAALVRVWNQEFPQPLTGVADPTSARMLGQAVRRAADAAVVGYQCKERALTALAVVRSRGVSADLVLGVRHLPLAAHVWVEAHGQVIADEPERCWQFEPVARFGSSGWRPSR
jgi:hypothetical protein